MHSSTLTSKTAITAILSIIGTAIGAYTGAMPIGTAAQTIITALLALFLKDGQVTTQNAIKENTAILNAQTEHVQNVATYGPDAAA